MSLRAMALRPKAKNAAQPSTLIDTAMIRLVSGVGFSNGWAELTLKTPPPLMPNCLMASWLAVANRAIFCGAPSRVVASTLAARVWGRPRATSTIDSTMHSGSST